MREMQRNYKRIIEKATKGKRPIVLGSHGNPQVVLIGVEEFRKLQERAVQQKQKFQWKRMKGVLDRISKQGLQGVSLSEFIRHDRQSH